MGFTFQNQCFTTQTEARDAYFQSVNPIILSNGNTVFYQLDPVSQLWKRLEVSPANKITFSTPPVPYFAPCDETAGFHDGVLLALAVTGAVVLAVTFGIISRAK